MLIGIPYPVFGEGEDTSWLPAVRPAIAPESYSPNTRTDYPDRVYWGDTHVHTNLSNDAYAMGNQILSPDDAYRFAKGETVVTHGGMAAKLHRPLDFLVVSDHAVNLGLMARLATGDPLLLNTEQGRIWLERFKANHDETTQALNATLKGFSRRMGTVFNNTGGKKTLWHYFITPRMSDPVFRHSVWDEVIANAERHNDPGTFTAFVGYEWTSNVRGAQHRNVIYRDGPERTSQVLPFSRLDSSDPEKLWAYLEEYAEGTGGDAIAIPHNGNISGGVTFALTNFNGQPLSREYAKTRAKWEPLNEVTQYKGDGEAYPMLSPEDEFADYETWHGWGDPRQQALPSTINGLSEKEQIIRDRH